MAEEDNTPPRESAGFTRAEAEVDDEPEGLLHFGTRPGTLAFVVQNLQAACQRNRRPGTGDGEDAGSPNPPKAQVPSAFTAVSASAEPDAAVAAGSPPASPTEFVSTDTWWAQRWIDKATPGEVSAMRKLLS